MKRSLLYIFAAIALAYIVRELEYMGIRMNKKGQFDKYNHLFLEKNSFDLLVIGSSRAETHFRPDIISDSTHLTCYNAGLLGATMPFIEGCLDAYLVHSKAPKYVVLNIDYHMFIAEDDTIRQFPSYFPYLSNDALYRKFSERDPRFPWFRHIPFYSLPYMGSKYLDLSIRGFLDAPGGYDTAFKQGYSPVKGLLKEDLDSVKIKPYSPWLSDVSWRSLNNIMNTCEARNIQLLLVYSPLYHRLSESILNEKGVIRYIDSVGAAHGCHSFDYHLTPITYDKGNFTDLDHLSRKGTASFSAEFSHDLLQYLRR